MNYDLEKNVHELMNAIKADYYRTITRGETDVPEHRLKMIDEFNADLGYEVGRKYVKITKDNGNSVWGFVMIEGDKMFRAGDILKAASWAAPARNKARGNILDGAYTIHWTGPNYL